MKKKELILKYFQKKDQLKVGNEEYQETISTLFNWLTDNDKVKNDLTSKYFPNKYLKAQIIAKEEGIAAGLEEIEFLLKKHTNLNFKPFIKDSLQFKKGIAIAEIKGRTHDILGYERTILNILQRLSGIASETSCLISLIRPISQIQIAATRKTPWMSLDKKAVAVGGGLTHRLNLSDGILIKDNHLKIISKAIKTPRVVAEALRHLGGGPDVTSGIPPMVKESKKLIEIEVEIEQQAHQAIKTFQKLTTTNYLAILLDNFTPSAAKSLISNLSNLYDLSNIIFEASGGISQKNIQAFAQTGVDLLSLGFLTHSPKAVNFSLELETK